MNPGVQVSAAEIQRAGGLLRWIDRQSLSAGTGRILDVKERKPSACPTEDVEQVEVMRWASKHETKYPALSLLFHIPNGGSRHKATAAKLKAQGVKRGVPDLCLPVPRNGFHGLWIEMKRIRGGRVEPEQREWHDRLTACGYQVVVCRGASAAKQVLKQYLGIEGET